MSFMERKNIFEFRLKILSFFGKFARVFFGMSKKNLSKATESAEKAKDIRMRSFQSKVFIP